MRRVPVYATEADLCEAFNAWARTLGWIPYAETAGWDVLLVHPEDGTQIGVQAKLKFNMKVLLQSIPSRYEACSADHRGPDYRVVLLPFHDGAANEICECLGLRTIWPSYRNGEFEPTFGADQWRSYHGWHFWNPAKRHELPAYVPDVAAGASGPVQLTRWKVAALQVAATLELRGYVTRQDFKRYGIDPRRWMNDHDWLIPGDKAGQFKRGPTLNFDKQHPDVYAQVLADVRKDLGVFDGNELRLTS
jgi:hypothetical protein